MKRFGAWWAAGLALLMAQPALAISIDFNPTSTSIGLGNVFGVDVIVSGLREGGRNEVVSAFDLDILYDATMLTAQGFEFGAALGTIDLDAFASSANSPGRLDVASVSLLDVSDLIALQSDQVLLGRLLFDATGVGHSLLTFDLLTNPGALLVGMDPFAPLSITSVGVGSIEVVGTIPTPVPEPATFPTLLLTSAGVAWMMRRRARTSPSLPRSTAAR